MKSFLSNFGAAIFMGIGWWLLCLFNLWAYSFPFQLEGVWGSGPVIITVYHPIAWVVLYSVGCGLMVPCAKKILNKNVSDVYLITVSLAVIAVYVYYVIMMVAGIKEFNATHEVRHGFYIIAQILGLFMFLLFSILSVLRAGFQAKQEAKEELK